MAHHSRSAQRALQDTIMGELAAQNPHYTTTPPVHMHHMQPSHTHHHHEHEPFIVQPPQKGLHPRPGVVEQVKMQESWVVGSGTETIPVDVFVLDQRYEMISQILFWITVMELAMAAAYAILGALVVSDSVTINNYLFTAIGAVFAVVVVLILHGFAIMRLWSRSSSMSHNHNREVRLPFFFGVFLLGIGFFILGRWISDHCTCCDTSDCQPDPADPEATAEFYAAWGVLIIMDVIWSYTVLRALFAHIYPESKIPTTADPNRTTLPLELQEEQKLADAERARINREATDIVQNGGRRTRTNRREVGV